MRRWSFGGGLLVTLVGMAVCGCAAPGPATADADVQGMEQISKLYEKATAGPRVHRFRKPLRDERDRVRRMLAEECDRMIAQLQTEPVAAEALTGTPPSAETVQGANTAALENSLASLANAARDGNERRMQNAYANAKSAYAGLGMSPSDP